MVVKNADQHIRENFAVALKLARRIHGINQAEAARRLGISTRQVAELERQAVAVKAFQVVALFKALHVSPDLSMGLRGGGIPTVEDVIHSIKSRSSDHEMKDQVFWQDFLDAVAIRESARERIGLTKMATEIA